MILIVGEAINGVNIRFVSIPPCLSTVFYNGNEFRNSFLFASLDNITS